MNCSEIKDLLPAYQGHDLEEMALKTVHNHLDSCPSCQEEERLLSASWAMLDSLEPITPSPQFRERLWARIEKEKARTKGFQGFPSAIGRIRRGGLLHPQGFRIPVLASVAGFIFVWAVGITGGITIYKSQAVRAPSVTETSVGIFTSPYPSESIESTFLQNAGFTGRQ